MNQRLCWRCGYRGRELQGPRRDTTFFCPSCGEDLYARPPLSYLEREGFSVPLPEGSGVSKGPHERPRRMLIRIPSTRFTLFALATSVSIAGFVALTMAVYAR